MPTIQDQLTLHEGKPRLKPYPDTKGKLTIGVGRNLTDRGITSLEASILLAHDIAYFEIQCSRLPWFPGLDPIRKRVLIDMCFNLGFEGLLMFQTFLKLCANQQWEAAAIDMLQTKWAMQVGSRATRLSEMLRSGLDYTPPF